MTPFIVAAVAILVGVVLARFILGLARAASRPMPSPLPIALVDPCGCFLLPSGEVVECGGHLVDRFRREGVL